ncbi:hypothetical protein ACNKHS_10400 [Shigella flexneri]
MEHQNEVDFLGKLNYVKLDEPRRKVRPLIRTAINAPEVILALAPETMVRSRSSLGSPRELTGRDHTHLALNKEDEKIRFRDLGAAAQNNLQPTWSRPSSEHVSYKRRLYQRPRADASTRSGRQQLWGIRATRCALGRA